MKGSALRKLFLILFIAAYSTACLGAIMMGQMKFFWTLIGCGVSVGAGEGISVWFTGNTLSTNITVSWKEGNWKSFWAYIMCASLVLCMLFLGLHFFPWEWVVG